MTQNSLVNRVIRKASRPIFSLLNVDAVTGLPVTRRNDLQRYGSRYGGWSIPASLLSERSVCYCVGCGEDITFDLALIEEFGCRVFGFDPTPRAVEHVAKTAGHIDKYVFSPIGLWHANTTLKFFQPQNPAHVSHSAVNLQKTDTYFEAAVHRLNHLMNANGHEHLTLLKLDIEGAEYSVVESILADNLSIDVLCVEYDEFFQPLDADFKQRIRRSLDSLLAANFVLVCSEHNGNYTFVHRRAEARNRD